MARDEYDHLRESSDSAQGSTPESAEKWVLVDTFNALAFGLFDTKEAAIVAAATGDLGPNYKTDPWGAEMWEAVTWTQFKADHAEEEVAPEYIVVR